MSSFTDRKTLMRCREQLEEKAMVHQHYRSSERGKAGMFRLEQVLLDFFSILELETFNFLQLTISSFQRLCISMKVSN